MAEAGGPHELDVSVGGDGDEDTFEGQGFALDLLGGVAVLGLGAVVEGAEGLVHGGGAAVPGIPWLKRKHSIGRAWEKPEAASSGWRLPWGMPPPWRGLGSPFLAHHGFAPVATIYRLLRRLRSFLPEYPLACPRLASNV